MNLDKVFVTDGLAETWNNTIEASLQETNHKRILSMPKIVS